MSKPSDAGVGLTPQHSASASEFDSSAAAQASFNVAERLVAMARERPEAIAIAEPRRPRPRTGAIDRTRPYRQITFGELDALSSRLASGLANHGIAPGTRLAMLVPPSVEFIALVFALLKAKVVSILIDPGMGRRNLVRCLAEAEPAGFVAIPAAHWVRRLLGRRFPLAKFNVTVARRRWLPDTITLDELAAAGDPSAQPRYAAATDPAAIIFTTGSTGPPKGVLYRHGNFFAQVSEIQSFYGIQPGEIDLPGFPLFGLFNAAMGVTTVLPDMDPTRPARVDPQRIVDAADQWRVTQAFGSPAIWNRVGRHCEQRSRRMSSLRRVLSAGAPVPAHVLERMRGAMAPDGDVHTPYGATEALPVASIAASEVLSTTIMATRRGAGVCVGRKFPGIAWKVIRIVDGPIADIHDIVELPAREIGELIVSGAVVTTEYVTRREANRLGKITDDKRVWHRMGDVGYLDEDDRFWYCGRLAHRVLTSAGPMYTEQCEAIFNNHPDIYRAALVGVGSPWEQRPVIICEPWPGRMPRGRADREKRIAELLALGAGSPLTASIRDCLLHTALPVDIRHNAKIFREKLGPWAAPRLRSL
jgi:acyl-CoA synthetase (AMP-forming)/AMP-acid ligase II